VSAFAKVNDSMLLIVDYRMYGELQEEIDNWSLDTFGYQPRVGMLLDFTYKEDAMLFLLRWA
jgi:hypothetical protein